MSDETFDLCECIWRNKLAVQRLLSILRQTQNHCSDIQCFSVSRLPGPQGSPPSPEFYFFTCLIIGFIVLMYAFRPQSLRQASIENKTPDNGHDSNGEPPAPPPTAN